MKKVIGAIQLIKAEINPGIVLIITTVVAMIIANSPLYEFYFKVFEETEITIDFNLWSLSKPLYYWINDGLMAIFFFLVGLEIKREILIGELSQPRNAMLPVVAAAGGMVVPALLFVIFNHNDADHINGWAIPMATDIAFAIGILALLKSKVPVELKIFLTTLAIVDDLGAVLTIAIFYTSQISVWYLAAALAAWLLLFILNKAGVRVFWVFILIGILGVWYPLLKSGIHATIAGILVAFTIPVNRKYNLQEFTDKAREAIKQLTEINQSNKSRLLKLKQYEAVENLKTYCEKASSPLQNLEHGLYNFTNYFIMPVFAFANTGIRFENINLNEVISNPLSIGIFIGLLIGKVTGIVLFVFVFYKLKLVQFPTNINWQHIIGAGFLAGIGFTMSIFITDLAFHGDQLITLSKISVLAASLCAGIIGFWVLKNASEKSKV